MDPAARASLVRVVFQSQLQHTFSPDGQGILCRPVDLADADITTLCSVLPPPWRDDHDPNGA
jgi:hypothetical protein